MTNLAYLHSTALNLDLKLDLNTGTVTVKDQVYKENRYVEYSAEECQIIKNSIGKIDKTVHGVKKIFGGIITESKYIKKVITETGIIEPDQFDLF